MGFCPPYTAPSDIGNVYVCTYATRPTGASLYEGRVIFETDTNTLAVYVDGAWQQIPQGSSGFRNAILNGAADVAQRGALFTTLGTSYHLDQWLTYHDGTGTDIIEQNPIYAAAYGSLGLRAKNYMRWRNNAVGTGSTFRLNYQNIEDVTTFNGQYVTLSFQAAGAYGYTGNYNLFVIQYFGSGGSPSGSVTPLSTTFAVTDGVMRKYSFTFFMPSVQGKTLGTDGKHCTYVRFGVPSPNAAFCLDATEIQFELGTAPTPFERRPYQTELALCQRYYQRYAASSINMAFAAGVMYDTTLFLGPFTFPVMRIAPAFNFANGTYDVVTGGSVTIPTPANVVAGNIEPFCAQISAIIPAVTLGHGGYIRLNTGYFDLSAEL